LNHANKQEFCCCRVELLPSTQSGNVAIVALDKGKRVKMNNLHKLLTHVGEDSEQKMAKLYGWEVYGTLEPCENCAIAKAHQKTSTDQLNPKVKQQPNPSVLT
jgi:hypothetical protein